MSKRLVMMAVDGLDWGLLRRWAAESELAALGDLLAHGAHAELDVTSCTFGLDGRGPDALLSPLLWTSAATGTYYFSHGIYDFRDFARQPETAPLFTSADVADARIWDILSGARKSSLVVGYMLTHPAAPIYGAMVSDRFGEVADPRVVSEGVSADALARAAGAADYSDLLRRDFAAGPMDEQEDWAEAPLPTTEAQRERVTRILTSFADEKAATQFLSGNDSPENMRFRSLVFHRLIYPVVRDERFHRVFVHLLRTCPSFSFAVCYYRSVDALSHGFWSESPACSERFRARYGAVVRRAYAAVADFVCQVRETLAQDDTLLIVSDHGFTGAPAAADYSIGDDLNYACPGTHAAPGVFLACGGETPPGPVAQVNLLDLCPTICDFFGLPQAEQFDGGVVPRLLHPGAPRSLPRVRSFAKVEASGGTRRQADDEQRILRHLAALGYIEE